MIHQLKGFDYMLAGTLPLEAARLTRHAYYHLSPITSLALSAHISSSGRFSPCLAVKMQRARAWHNLDVNSPSIAHG